MNTKRLALLTLATAASLFGGGLRLEIGPGNGAQSAITTRVVSCKEPAKSVITATLVRRDGNVLQQTRIKVVMLPGGSEFAVTGDLAAVDLGAIELSVANPEFPGYEPKYLMRVVRGEVQYRNVKRFDNRVAPKTADFNAMIDGTL
jgi:hypothetical protein